MRGWGSGRGARAGGAGWGRGCGGVHQRIGCWVRGALRCGGRGAGCVSVRSCVAPRASVRVVWLGTSRVRVSPPARHALSVSPPSRLRASSVSESESWPGAGPIPAGSTPRASVRVRRPGTVHVSLCALTRRSAGPVPRAEASVRVRRSGAVHVSPPARSAGARWERREVGERSCGGGAGLGAGVWAAVLRAAAGRDEGWGEHTRQ